MKNNYTVYKHTSPVGKVYIGITGIGVEKRWGYNGNGYHGQPFYNAILKYGWDNIKHEVLFTGLTKEEAESKEIELIALYKSNDSKYGYNADNGGFSVGRCGEQTKKKISDARKGSIPWNKGIPRTAEERHKMSMSHMGKTKGEKNGNYGKPMSAEAKAKLSKANRNKPAWNKGKKNTCTKEQVQRIKETNSKPVVCVETMVVYASVTEASQSVGVSITAVANCLKGKTSKSGGYHWRYAELTGRG